MKSLVQACGGINIMNLRTRTFDQYSKTNEDAYRVNKRKDALAEKTKQRINTFYEDSSIHLPLRRQAGRKLLMDTTERLHRSFSENVPDDDKISLSTFRKHRPKEYLTVNKTKFIGCLCEYCINMDYAVS